ncbi:unnamed protein product [Sphacelaria rigidula]
MAMAVAVQERWPLHHVDVTYAFVRATIYKKLYMKLPEGYGTLTGNTPRLGRSINGLQ